MNNDAVLNALREAQEAIYAAQSGAKQNHWQVVWRSVVRARALLEAVRLDAHRRLAKESEVVSGIRE